MLKPLLITLGILIAIVLIVDWVLKRRRTSGIGEVGGSPIVELGDAFRELKTGAPGSDDHDKD